MHYSKVLRALKGNGLRQTRKLLGIKPRPKLPVLSQDIDTVVDRHGWLCRRFQELLPAGLNLSGMEVCEAGPGDCLATTAMVLAMGARHVDLVEIEPPVINEKQAAVLRALREQRLPIDLDLVVSEPKPHLNPAKATYHTMFMDDFVADRKHGLVYSFCVLEHVENLETFFASCFRATRPGGINIHVIDLGGHGEFEDPVPPLDFQTYPDWLYHLMYPPFHRATRRFVGDYKRAMQAVGFEVEEVRKLRIADSVYVKFIHPKLRPAARHQSLEELGVIEFAIIARRPE